ncbi:hypothetical protein NMG60_11030911 [Bertholletia excelsa]
MDSNKVEIENSGRELKHLGFLRIIVINSLVCMSNLYDYAKQNSGPLRSTVGTVERAVTTVIRPVYEKLKGVPDDLLAFVDEKVDEAANKLNKHAPPTIKKVVVKSYTVVQKASGVVLNFIHEARTGGPCSAIHYAGTVYVHLCLNILARFWYAANKITVLHVIAQMAVPTVAHWSEKYNNTILHLNGKGYTAFGYLPQVPINEIAKAYKQIETEKGPACAPCASEKDKLSSD